MQPGGMYIRILAALLMAALPPLLLAAALLAAEPAWLVNRSPSVVLLLVTAAAAVWAAILAVPYARSLGLDLRSIVRLAERGRFGEDDQDAGPATPQQRLAAALDERNRQMSALAAEVQAAPITDDARLVATHVVSAARAVTRDPTWVLAVFEDGMPHILPAGVYGAALADGIPGPLQDLHRWAAVTGTGADGRLARRIDGPWGAFVALEVTAGDRLRGVLLAPWEGRPKPSPAELTLFTLLGQHAATAIDHALLYAQMRRQADELDRLAGVQRDFLRGISHDLQTPLTSIGALASELRARPGTSPNESDDLEMIEHQAERLRRMVGQLLVVSRLEAGAIQPRSDVFRPEALVRRTWQALRPPDRELALEHAGDDHLAVADPDRVEQILWALLDNAVKYSPPATPILVTLAGRPGRGESFVSELAITDRGIGMDDETRQRAFDQFYRSERARSLVPDGSGVGLYAARGLARLMGGELTVESAVGEGSRFTLRLPGERTAEGGRPAEG